MRARVWVFDLDNTLHDATPHIFPHINRGMTDYLQKHLGLDREEADSLRKFYWERYGAPLHGMMLHHDIKPEHFLAQTHHFPELAKMVVGESQLRHSLRDFSGKKIVFSNAPLHYARAVLRILRIDDLFDGVFSIEYAKFRPKPGAYGFFRIFRKMGLNPSRFIMVEDTLANLRMAKKLGMKTVWVTDSRHRPSYVDMNVSSIRDLSRRQFIFN